MVTIDAMEHIKRTSFEEGESYARTVLQDEQATTIRDLSASHAAEIERLVAKHDLEVSTYETEKEKLQHHVSTMSMSISPIVKRVSVGRGSGNISVRASPRMPQNIGSLQLPTFGVTTSTPVVGTPSAAAGQSSNQSLVVSSQKKTSGLNTRAAFLAGSSDEDL